MVIPKSNKPQFPPRTSLSKVKNLLIKNSGTNEKKII